MKNTFYIFILATLLILSFFIIIYAMKAIALDHKSYETVGIFDKPIIITTSRETVISFTPHDLLNYVEDNEQHVVDYFNPPQCEWEECTLDAGSYSCMSLPEVCKWYDLNKDISYE